ncbi:MAG TPA: cupin domain-containing protein [Verrucomicrobiae bacterium]|nr:cupin domain-containing protein [Verrucomicrobiae bacterium]
MKRIRIAAVVGAMLAGGAAGLAEVHASLQEQPRKPLTMPAACGEKDCTLLGGAPVTAGLRSGFVRLQPGETVGWHTTGAHEEELVILHGKGEAEIEGRSGLPIGEGAIAYIPPQTRHNVKNTGTEALEYVYVVAPVSETK